MYKNAFFNVHDKFSHWFTKRYTLVVKMQPRLQLRIRKYRNREKISRIDLKKYYSSERCDPQVSVLFYRTWLYLSSCHYAMFYTHNHQDVAVLWRRRHQHHGASCRHQPLDHSMGNHHPVRMDPTQNTVETINLILVQCRQSTYLYDLTDSPIQRHKGSKTAVLVCVKS